VIAIGPVDALAGTVTYSVVAVLFDPTKAGVPLNVTELVDGVGSNPDPLIVMTSPTTPDEGENPLIVGALVTVKAVALSTGTPPVVTSI
jgi:hypothetical protein